jgi:hypothetical protein
MTDAELDLWATTGVHDVISHATCVVCLATDQEVVSSYACDCNAMVCRACLPLVSVCPTCAAGTYVCVTADELETLVAAPGSTEHYNRCLGVFRLLRNILQRDKRESIHAAQLVCRVADIDALLQRRGVTRITNAVHSLYGFAVDCWKTTFPDASTIRCYKGYFDDHCVHSYQQICIHRHQGDLYHWLSVKCSV